MEIEMKKILTLFCAAFSCVACTPQDYVARTHETTIASNNPDIWTQTLQNQKFFSFSLDKKFEKIKHDKPPKNERHYHVDIISLKPVNFNLEYYETNDRYKKDVDFGLLKNLTNLENYNKYRIGKTTAYLLHKNKNIFIDHYEISKGFEVFYIHSGVLIRVVIFNSVNEPVDAEQIVLSVKNMLDKNFTFTQN